MNINLFFLFFNKLGYFLILELIPSYKYNIWASITVANGKYSKHLSIKEKIDGWASFISSFKIFILICVVIMLNMIFVLLLNYLGIWEKKKLIYII